MLSISLESVSWAASLFTQGVSSFLQRSTVQLKKKGLARNVVYTSKLSTPLKILQLFAYI
jgi:hypothetical protein